MTWSPTTASTTKAAANSTVRLSSQKHLNRRHLQQLSITKRNIRDSVCCFVAKTTTSSTTGYYSQHHLSRFWNEKIWFIVMVLLPLLRLVRCSSSSPSSLSNTRTTTATTITATSTTRIPFVGSESSFTVLHSTLPAVRQRRYYGSRTFIFPGKRKGAFLPIPSSSSSSSLLSSDITTQQPKYPRETAAATTPTATATATFHSSSLTSLPYNRGIKFWFSLRGGGANLDPDNPASTTGSGRKEGYDVSLRLKPFPSLLRGDVSVSVCSVQGYRSHMEDEFLVVAPDFCGVFDGHGGNAISRYVRQNLYATVQGALAQLKQQKSPEDYSSSSSSPAAAAAAAAQEANDHDSIPVSLQNVSSSSVSSSDPKSMRHMAPNKIRHNSSATIITQPQPQQQQQQQPPPVFHPTIDDYELALHRAFAKIDKEVLRINHWSFQGSTAAIVWFHEQEVVQANGNSTMPINEHSQNINDSVSSSSSRQNPSSQSSTRPSTMVRHIVTANIGDSRVVLSRQGAALDLSRDHKPNDPKETARILAAGGQVIWHGQTDQRTGRPIDGTGLYRVNGNLALSRAIGDRSERPAVTAEPEMSIVRVEPDLDDFVVLATDGLWDVMSSAEVVEFVHEHLQRIAQSVAAAAQDQDDEQQDDSARSTDTPEDLREGIASRLVEEALMRGTFDNVTVIIVWLRDGLSTSSYRHECNFDEDGVRIEDEGKDL